MVLQSQSSLERIEQSFNEVAREFLATELADGGRTIQNRSRLSHGMKLHLSPIESRHEAAIRTLVGMVGALAIRVKRLENPNAEEPDMDSEVPGESASASENESALLDALEKPTERDDVRDGSERP